MAYDVRILIAAFVLSGAAGAQQPTQPSNPTSVVAAPVTLLISARPKDGSVANLSIGDLDIKEDGRPVPVQQVRRLNEAPMHYCVLFDTSNSESLGFRHQQAIAVELLKKTLRKGIDRGWLVLFNEQSRESDETDDWERLAGAIVASRPGGATALYDAITGCSDRMMRGTQSSSIPAMFLFSDGGDNNSRHNLYEAVEAALHANARIYAFGAAGEREPHGMSTLEKLADNTGGRVSFPSTAKDVDNMSKEIQNDLNGAFAVTYSSQSSKPYDQPRLVEVTCRTKGIAILAPKRAYVSASLTSLP
jgi:VWFA-related protein